MADETTTTVETTTEPTELSDLRAELERIKRSNDDLSKENASYKRRERERMTEEEKKQEELAERERRYAEMEKRLALRDYSDELSGIGDKKAVDKIAGLLTDGEILQALKEFKAMWEKAKVEIETKVRDELMQKNPQPSAQGGKPKKTAEEIMQIADPVERQRAIAENIELFN